MKGAERQKSLDLVMMSVFTAIIIIQALIPMLGYIPVGIMNATIIQVTVALGAILLGAKKGAALGAVFGLTSMWKNTFMPNISSFVFSPFIEIGGYRGDYRSVIICMLPRIMVGLIAAFVFSYFKGKNKRKWGLILAGALSSAVNTILVMGGIFFLFGREYADATNRALHSLPYIIMGIIGTQGALEALVSALLCLGVGSILLKTLNK